nr:RNA-directed DNA polymerase, eukaryota [Tanacetum cinerariifolium]
EWSNSNLKNVIKMLQCFFYVSVLKINIDKCQLLGLGVSRNSVAQAAAEIGCKVLCHQFRYLGVTKVLASMRHGGLGVSSYYALNRALILKWHSSKQTSIWCSIIREVQFPRMFALDTEKEVTVADKLGSSSLNASFRRNVRDGAERQQWDELHVVLSTFSLSSLDDRWHCDLSGDGSFQVKEVRNCIDDMILPTHSEVTRWVKVIPKKINIFVWRARRDCLPTRHNLTLRGVSLVSDSCPMCEGSVESLHTFEVVLLSDTTLNRVVSTGAFIESPR